MKIFKTRSKLKKVSAKRARKLISFILLLALFFVSFTLVRADSQADKLVQEKSQELDKFIQEQNQRIEDSKLQQKSLKDEIATIEKQEKESQAKINSLNQQIEATQKDIDSLNNEITINQAKLRKEQEKLKDGIRLLYERGDADPVEVLASNNSLSSFVNEEKYVVAINQDIVDSTKNIRNIKTELENKRKEAEKKKEDQGFLMAEQQRMSDQLRTSIMAKNTLLENTKGNEALYQKLIEQALLDKAEVASMVQGISAGRSAVAIGLPYSGARAGQHVMRGEVVARSGNTGFSSGPHLHFGVYRNGQDVDPMPLLTQSMMSFPVPGAQITQDFMGTYSHKGRGPGWPGGIDFGIAEGTPIRSAKEGVIIFDGVGKAGLSGGFGHYMVIDHHNGLLTLYAHLK